MASKELVVPETSKYFLPAVKEDQSRIDPILFGKDRTKAVIVQPALALATCGSLSVAVTGIVFSTGLEPAVSVTSGLIMLGAGLVTGVAEAISWTKINRWIRRANGAFKAEEQRVKELLYANFGRSAGITPEIITSCCLRSHSWVHNNESFIVTFDDDTALYSFERRDFFAGMSDASPLNSFQEELKPFFLKLKATDVVGEPAELLKELIGSVSQLVQSELDVEQKHEVKRLVVDASELVRISSDLAVYDETAAQTKLAEGLRPLTADATALTTEKRELISRQLDSYNNYVEVRSISA